MLNILLDFWETLCRIVSGRFELEEASMLWKLVSGSLVNDPLQAPGHVMNCWTTGRWGGQLRYFGLTPEPFFLRHSIPQLRPVIVSFVWGMFRLSTGLIGVQIEGVRKVFGTTNKIPTRDKVLLITNSLFHFPSSDPQSSLPHHHERNVDILWPGWIEKYHHCIAGGKGRKRRRPFAGKSVTSPKPFFYPCHSSSRRKSWVTTTHF